MEKKVYETPTITVYGDVKEITKGGGADLTSPDETFYVNGKAFTAYDPVS